MAKPKKDDPGIAAKDQKLQELILYICERCEGDRTFGATKQNKLLFYSDFLAYLNFGRAITEQEYFRLPQGPCPRRWVPVSKKMIARGDITIKKSEYYGFPQNRTMPMRRANLSLFSAEEIALVDKVVETHWGRTAADISDETHGFIGWKLAADRETIPYSVATVSLKSLTEREERYAKQLQGEAVAALTQYGSEQGR